MPRAPWGQAVLSRERSPLWQPKGELSKDRQTSRGPAGGCTWLSLRPPHRLWPKSPSPCSPPPLPCRPPVPLQPPPPAPLQAPPPAPLQAAAPGHHSCLFQTTPTPPSAPGSPRKTSSASRPQPQLCKRESSPCPRHVPQAPEPLRPLLPARPIVTLKAGRPAALLTLPHPQTSPPPHPQLFMAPPVQSRRQPESPSSAHEALPHRAPDSGLLVVCVPHEGQLRAPGSALLRLRHSWALCPLSGLFPGAPWLSCAPHRLLALGREVGPPHPRGPGLAGHSAWWHGPQRAAPRWVAWPGEG